MGLVKKNEDRKPKLCIFTLYDTRGASSRFRIYQYKEKFDKYYDTKIFSFWTNKYNDYYINNKKKYWLRITLLYIIQTVRRSLQIMFFAAKSDIVIFQKAVIPKNPINFISYLKKCGTKVVFDVDDAIYLETGDYSKQFASKMDLILVGNEELLKFYLNFNAKVYQVPTVENSNIFKQYINDTFSNKCIGWLGSLRTINNLDIVIDVVNEIVEKHPEVTFKFIADGPDIYKRNIKNSIFVKWDENYLKNIKDFTIGIMPLKKSTYNVGKCGFKLIQYLNLEIPVLASDVGGNANIVSDYGVVCNTAKDWKEAIERLLFDRKEYDKCVKNIQSTFYERFGYENNWIYLKGLLDELIT